MELFRQYKKAFEQKPEIVKFLKKKIEENPNKSIIVTIVDLARELGPEFETKQESALIIALKFVLSHYDIFAESTTLNEINPKTNNYYQAFILKKSTPEDIYPKTIEYYFEKERLAREHEQKEKEMEKERKLKNTGVVIELLGRQYEDYILRDEATKKVLIFDYSIDQEFDENDLEYISILDVPQYTIGELNGNMELFINMRTRKFATIFNFENSLLIKLDLIKMDKVKIDRKFTVEKVINIENKIRQEIKDRNYYIDAIRSSFNICDILNYSVRLGYMKDILHLRHVKDEEFYRKLKTIMWQNFNINLYTKDKSISKKSHMLFKLVKPQDIFDFK